MIKAGLLSLIFLTAILILSSCSDKRVYCTVRGPMIRFEGVDTGRITQIGFVGYAPNGRFDQPLDSFVFTIPTNDRGFGWKIGNTVSYPELPSPPDRDYRITLLPLGRTWALSGIQYQTGAYRDLKNGSNPDNYDMGCPMGTYIVDGQRVSFPETDNPGTGGITLKN